MTAMASDALVTSFPTIPSSWTAPSSCFKSTNFYRVFFSTYPPGSSAGSTWEGGFLFTDMYGEPTPTGDCFPPSFTSDAVYITDGGCPAGYRFGCERGGSTMCCPSVTSDAFEWKCGSLSHGCYGTARAGDIWSGMRTDISPLDLRLEPLTVTPNSGDSIVAWGITMISVSATSTATEVISTTALTTASSPTPTDNDNEPSSGLSSGALAGIVVGAVAAVAILAFVAFMVYRRKRKTQASNTNYNAVPLNGSQERHVYPGPVKDTHGNLHEAPDTGPNGNGRDAWELQG